MLDGASKAFFHLLAKSHGLKTLASRYGMRGSRSFARRFIAGETTAEAIEAARAVEGRGLLHTLDHLGESVGSLATADAATREYREICETIVGAGIGRNISLKLTQLGLDVDRASAVDNLRKILDRTDPAGFFVRIDMENSAYTQVTLDIFETLWNQGHRQIGVVLQAALHRTEQDLARILSLGGRVRLVGDVVGGAAERIHRGEAAAALARQQAEAPIEVRGGLAGDRLAVLVRGVHGGTHGCRGRHTQVHAQSSFQTSRAKSERPSFGRAASTS